MFSTTNGIWLGNLVIFCVSAAIVGFYGASPSANFRQLGD
jgi:hypothetical protein